MVPGQPSQDLTDKHLIFDKDDGTSDWADDYLTNNNDANLVFKPLFKIQGAQPANIHKGHGISVDTRTGVVTLDANLPSPRKNNFIMEVEVTESATGNVIDTDYIRIHVHQSITQIWLTPNILTVRPFSSIRPEDTNYRFSVRAQFDNSIVGDITNMPNLVWSPAVNVDPSDGNLILKAGDTSSDIINITVTLPAPIGGRTALGTMLLGDAWDAANPIDISIVVGGGWPGTINPAKVPNVLLLGDGFTNANRTAFNQYVNSLVQFLKINPLNKPYDVLSTSMNFWTAFLPSRETGISVNGEIYPVGDDADLKARYVPGPKKPPSGHAGIWSLSQLIYMVGLPLLTDDKSNSARSNNDIKTEWQQLIDVDPNPHVNNRLINRWRKLAKRSLIDQTDSYLGVRSGDMVSDPSDMKDINLSKSRISRDNMDHLLRTLRDPRGVPVQDLWAKTALGTKPNNYDLVCIVVAGNGRALNSDGYFFVDVVEDIKIARNSGNTGYHFNYSNTDIPNTANNDISRTFAHELTHSFAIGDEYGEREGPPVGLTSQKVDEDGNLTLIADARNGSNDIDGNEIKWNWHRIKKAAQISETIVDVGGGKFRVPLILGQGYQFALGDTVHLRFREYPKPLPKRPKLSPPLEITSPEPTSSTVHVKVKPAVVFNYPNIINTGQFVAEFTPGSIIYIPTLAPESVRNSNSYPYAEIVAKNIKDFITTSKKPLTTFPSVVDDNNVQQPRITGVSLPDCFSRHRPQIVGLYSGGKGYHKGIFHPTGNCLMRDSHTDGKEICAVCRYVLVDIIDPQKHSGIDREYDKIYPQE